MGAKLQAWWKRTKRPLEVIIITFPLGILIALFIVVIMGYVLKWSWTGLSQKTLWDWLQLLIIPAVLAIGGYLFNFTMSRNEQKSTQLRDQTERDVALDNQREAALQDYIDKISELLLHEKLADSAEEAEVRKIARVRTLTILPRLDATRKRSVLQFLYESELIDKDRCIVRLSGADLSGADLSGADLSQANLYEVNLSGANLSRTNLSKARLGLANVSGADLSFANLSIYPIKHAEEHKDFEGAELTWADLSHAIFSPVDPNAEPFKYRFDPLSFVRISLLMPLMSSADLTRANLQGTDLSEADLSGANLKDAQNTTAEQLDKAKSLKGATMPDGSKHP